MNSMNRLLFNKLVQKNLNLNLNLTDKLNNDEPTELNNYKKIR